MRLQQEQGVLGPILYRGTFYSEAVCVPHACPVGETGAVHRVSGVALPYGKRNTHLEVVGDLASEGPRKGGLLCLLVAMAQTGWGLDLRRLHAIRLSPNETWVAARPITGCGAVL